MPNWTFNELVIERANDKGLEAEHILEKITSKEQDGEIYLDFNKIIEMPKSLEIESGSFTTDCLRLALFNKDDDIKAKIIKYYKNKSYSGQTLIDIQNDNEQIINKLKEQILSYNTNTTTDEHIKLGEQVIDNILTHNAEDWYEWSIKHWGTKWNAGDTSIGNDCIFFTTAWSPMSTELLDKLSRMFPNNKFTLKYAEEQMTCFGGIITYIDGKKIDEVQYHGESKELWELSFFLCGGEDMYKWNEEKQTYEYIDEDEEESNEIL